MSLAMCEVPVHPVEFLSESDLTALPVLPMTQAEDGTWYCDGESTQDGTPSPDNPVPIINTYPAGTYKAICGDKIYKVVLDDDLRSVPGVADRVRIDAGRGLCWVERKVNACIVSDFPWVQYDESNGLSRLECISENKKFTGTYSSNLICSKLKTTLYNIREVWTISERNNINRLRIYASDGMTMKEILEKVGDADLYYALATPTTHQSVPTQLTTITAGRSATIEGTVNDAVDFLAVKGDSWQKTQEQGKNLVNPDELEIGGLSGNIGGNFTASNRIRTGFIPVEEGTKYIFSGYSYSVANAHIYDSSKTRIAQFNFGMAITSGGKYIRASFKKSTEEDFTEEELQDLKSTIMFEEGDTATDYEPFQPAMPSPEYPSEIVSVEGEMESCGWNLWDKGDVAWERNYAVRFYKPMKAGIYTFIADVESSDTDSDLCLVLPFDTYENAMYGSAIEIERGTKKYGVFNATADFNRISFYASTSNNMSAGDTFSFKNIQIVQGTTPKPYDRHRGNAITLPVLRSLPDGTADVLYVDRTAKRAWVERYVGEKVFDGGEKFLNKDNVGWQYFLNNIGRLVCSHFKENTVQVKDSNTIRRAALTTFVFYPDFYDKGMDYWKEWLADQYYAGTPVTVQYQLSGPIVEELPYSDYLLETAQYETNLRIDCDEHLEPEIGVTVKVLGR